MFYSIINAFIESEEYMIDPKSFVLNQDYIFVDVTNLNALLICLPIINYDNNTNLSELFKNIMFTLNFDQTENTDYVAKIISYLNSSSNFSLLEFKKILVEILDNDSSKKNNTDISAKISYIKKENKSEFSNSISKKDDKNTQISQMKNDRTQNKQENNNDKNSADKQNYEKKASETAGGNSEKKMSFFHLMTNFSKENLEVYKSQKKSGENTQQNGKKSVQNVSVPFAVPKKNEQFEISNKKSEINSVNQNKVQTQPSSFQTSEHTQSHNNMSEKKNNNSSNETNHKNTFNQKKDFGATVYFDEDSFNSTLYIDENMIPDNGLSDLNPRIIRKKNNESAEITTSPFKIGKEPTFADYCITGNPAISGCHAFIVFDNDAYYIKDTNSTNHVYINGKRIQTNILVPINHNDVIKLANEDFEFKLY